MKVRLDYTAFTTKKMQNKLKTVEKEMTEVLSSELFKENLFNVLYINDYQKGERSKWADKGVNAVFDFIITGAEIFDPTPDGEADIIVKPYHAIWGAIGKADKTSPTIWSNTAVVGKYVFSTMKLGSNYFHEWGHKLGFSHDRGRTKYRPLSLCYLMNKAYEKTYKEIYGIPKKKVCRRHGFLWLKKSCRWV